MTNILLLSGIVGASVSLIVTMLLNSHRQHRSDTRSMSPSRSQEVQIWE